MDFCFYPSVNLRILQMIFGSVQPLESYCAHLLLSKDEIYFTVLETKGSCSVYGPRPAVQVHILQWLKLFFFLVLARNALLCSSFILEFLALCRVCA